MQISIDYLSVYMQIATQFWGEECWSVFTESVPRTVFASQSSRSHGDVGDIAVMARR